ncbi:hypothetical protein L3X38_032740 [Prunus dulcis]|uniref:Uncharacterized protein n=1 Tax=Prunus dulcis TaxID=3755 RepID=A0AAD4VFS0_PRUDU|nr:hypothetical protein L3X38_032740 [Prunus dulcis]
MRAELMAELDTARYTNKSSPKIGFESRGDLEWNRLRAPALPVRLCISFTVEGDFISRMALICRGCASIPRCVTRYPKNWPEDTPKVHFTWFQLHAILAEQVECLGGVFDVICTLWGLDQHVIHIDFHNFANLLLEDFIHEPLVGCSGVLQPKGHDLVAVGPSLNDERSFCLVVLMHYDLVIARVGIHEAEQLITRCGIHELVNSRQWEVVFRACFVEVNVIDADSSFGLFLFRHQNNVGQPLRVGDLFDEAGS